MAFACCQCITPVLLLFVIGFGILPCHSVNITVRNSADKICIYADMMINFTVQYQTITNKTRNATLQVPDDVITNGSFCGNESSMPLLKISFGKSYEHYWSISFTNTTSSYKGHELTFAYNISDKDTFPDAKEEGIKVVLQNDTMDYVPLNEIYRCNSVDVIYVSEVFQIFWNVHLQAFVDNGTISTKEFVCKADISSTTAAPTTAAHTTTPAANTTTPAANTTTPAANATTVPVTTAAPTSSPPVKPDTGKYNVTGKGGDICLLATVGLQLSYSSSTNKTDTRILNINPNLTQASGSCNESGRAVLTLTDGGKFVEFTFAILIQVCVDPFSGGNDSLNYWQASVGSSYMCNKEQRIVVTENITLSTFSLQVQPFSVTKGNFSKAEECSTDKDNYIVPIAVGVALGGLIIIVIVAYIIGRRRSKAAGYEQFS
ncbi:lysosome-associated membrane glycoprotein 2 [Protopterus annectens]|uniref:lysosome-associated membrane glycoprotein 2 n=1 Tax=Protopterus annectens TaxID=7888 RepID=UPI001CFB17BD|nr:lysosome-associated membrane glycoprotein 2 [Protopterus annectens]